ncbi:hypothetical protein P3X46_026042 [Hevea brasiliensis]|uniref:WAT1-related protein n=1 Tax=Hevea brasiliensis TaxID=3981 RepID=A0ABQ9KWT4_HEVBR|nr:WAT1-related protein At5g40230 isoform X1 [Hevea brasiliensis]KAJ9152481.1 hypothetical protein P3X46_026042 [Hevea brasiliensis]
MAWSFLYEDFLPFVAMVSVECANVGVNILFKAASSKRMSYHVFIVYSYAIASLLLIPVPFFFRSIPVRSSLKLPLLSRIWILAFIGFLAQIVGNNAIKYSSPTFASAMSNLTPVFTFAFAVIFRREKLVIRCSSTQAKVIGTLTAIGGALVVDLYRGPKILSTLYPFPRQAISLDWPMGSPNSDWLIGGLLLATLYLLQAFCNILQTRIMKICSKELLVTFIYTLSVTIISAPVCFVAEKNLDALRLRPDIALVAIVSSGIFGTCYKTAVRSWGLRQKGPVYIAIFKPLSIAIAAFVRVIFLGDPLHLGIIIGALVISMGICAVLWGKANEGKLSERHGCANSGDSSTESVPFLQTSVEDV